MHPVDPSLRVLRKAVVSYSGAAFFYLGVLITASAQYSTQVYVQGPQPAPSYYPETPPPPPAANPLDQLLAPIALYPDPLISLILPAAAFPSDIAAAGAYLNQGGDPGQVDNQPWEPSVRSLAHYPDVVKWMAQNGPWTQTVGATFVSDPASVMGSIQRLREIARAAGTLTDTPQQQVVVDGNYVEIEPAQADAIYVPHYDPQVVFVDQPYYGYNGPFFTYGPAYVAGPWLTFGCNWYGGGVVIVGAGYWHGGGGWWHPYGPGRAGFSASVGFRAWGFPSNRTAPRAPAGWQTRAQIVSPRIARGAPERPPQSAYRNITARGPAAVSARAREPSGVIANNRDRANNREGDDGDRQSNNGDRYAAVRETDSNRSDTRAARTAEPASRQNVERGGSPGHTAKPEARKPANQAKPKPQRAKEEKPKSDDSHR